MGFRKIVRNYKNKGSGYVESGIEGYLFIPAKQVNIEISKPSWVSASQKCKDELFKDVRAGMRFDTDTIKPPWIVVHHSVDKITPSCWPGRLWRVRVVNALHPQGHYGNYTRAISVDIIGEVDTTTLFGANGDIVIKIIDFASELSLVDAQTLADQRNKNADKIYSNGWNNWIQKMDIREKNTDNDWAGILSIASPHGCSPIGEALSTVYSQISKSAVRQSGNDAFIAAGDVYGDNDVFLSEPWSTASATLLDAALAEGASDLFTPKEKEILTAPWHQISMR